MTYKTGQLLRVKAASISFLKAPDNLDTQESEEEEVGIEIVENDIVMIVSTREEGDDNFIKVLFDSGLYERKVWGEYATDWFEQIESK